MYNMTAKQFLRHLKRNLFKDVDILALAAQDKPDDHHVMLEQIERLLDSEPSLYLITWFSDQFWMGERKLYLIDTPHPLLDDANIMGRQEDLELSDDDYLQAQWLTRLALFCHQLYSHEPFDTDWLQPGLSLGAKCHKAAPSEGRLWQQDKDLLGHVCADDFMYANKKLVQWIRTTPYRRLASLVTHTMLDKETDRAIATNQVVQDYYAYRSLSGEVSVKNVADCENSIQLWLDLMQEMYEHYEQGKKLGLSDEQIRVTDALWEFVPHNYDDDTVNCAREFCEKAEQLLPPKPYIKSENGARKYQRETLPVLQKIADRWNVSFNDHDIANLAASYTYNWLYDKYYQE